MGNRVVVAGLLAFLAAGSARAQDPAAQFFNGFSGRYHCSGNWIDLTLRVNPISGPLGIDDPGAGVVAVLTLLVRRSLTGSDAVPYKLTGPYDRKTGQFRLTPQQWTTSQHPPGLEMIGLDGKYDFVTHQITAKMISDKCDVVEFAAPGKPLPPVPQADASRYRGPRSQTAGDARRAVERHQWQGREGPEGL